MCDNEQTAPSLGHGPREPVHSDILSVQHSVGPPIPEFPQEPEEGAHRPSVVVRQESGDILPRQPRDAKTSSQRQELKREVAARIIQAEPLSRDAEGLAGGASDKKVNWSDMVGLNLGEVVEERRDVAAGGVAVIPIYGGRTVALLKDSARECLNLRISDALEVEAFVGDGERAVSAAHVEVANGQHYSATTSTAAT